MDGFRRFVVGALSPNLRFPNPRNTTENSDQRLVALARLVSQVDAHDYRPHVFPIAKLMGQAASNGLSYTQPK